MARIGVFVCHCGKNIAGVVNIDEIVKFASTLNDVVVVKDYKYMCSDPGGTLIKDTVKEYNLDRVVVAACSPRMHEATFQNVISEVGLNPYCLEIANIREHCSWVHPDNPEKATEKAKTLVEMAVAKARLLEPLERAEVEVVPSALVIGGGIAGIQAALDLADQGKKVYLVEKEPSIGGRMAQLDKTFPTLDCSSCILTPKMMEVARHPNIELMTYSEVIDVKGNVGNFTVTVKKKATYVDWDKCTGCGACIEVCRMKDRVKDEFNLGLGKRGAVYIPFPQAVPLKATIDPESCIYIKAGVCGDYPPCKRACEADAIDHSMKDKYIELNVGAIIVTTGYDLLNAEIMYEYGYGTSQNVITNLEFERLVNAAGPTNGEILRPSDGSKVKSVSFILCVGSRDEDCMPYCCRIGCMSALKHAYLIREHLGSEVEINICYNDIRSFGRSYEEFYRRVRGLNINFIRGRPSEIRIMDNGQLNFDVFDTSTKKLLQVTTDLVVLVPALVPRKDADEIARLLRISQGADGFFLEAHPKLRPVDTATSGIFIAGCCTGPKDIPDTVAQASAAAAKAAALLSKDKLRGESTVAIVDEDLCSGCGICEGVCPYGAIEMVAVEGEEGKRVAKVNAALCEGCGACVSACPSGAMEQKGFKTEQLYAMLDAALKGQETPQ